MDKENLAFDQDLSALSLRFSRSTSLKQPLYSLKGSPESWSDFAHPYTGEEFFRQPQLCRPPSFSQTAWHPPRQLRTNHTKQQVVFGGSGGGATAAKRECPGTGVFLPRRYCNSNNNPPESRKRQACSPANLPAARTNQYANNTLLVHITGHPPQTQARINVGLVPPHYEMLMDRRNAMIVAAQQLRRSIGGGGVESSPVAVKVNNPTEVLLPQEWTY